VIEPIAWSGSTPPLGRLTHESRGDLYGEIIIVTAALLGFILTAITILVSLDGGRPIVKELRLGEAFKLLVTNMLAAVVLLLIVTVMGICGSVLDTGTTAAASFERFYEWLVLAVLLELGLSGFYFGLLTYKVAAYD
jgi:hypothetical protein